MQLYLLYEIQNFIFKLKRMKKMVLFPKESKVTHIILQSSVDFSEPRIFSPLPILSQASLFFLTFHPTCTTKWDSFFKKKKRDFKKWS